METFGSLAKGIIDTSVSNGYFEKRYSILTKNRFIQCKTSYPWNLILCIDLKRMEILNFKKINNIIKYSLS